ncbi:MAG: trypsin-like peptidase domain-containing protein [Anaerovoracaceae bacterium]
MNEKKYYYYNPATAQSYNPAGKEDGGENAKHNDSPKGKKSKDFRFTRKTAVTLVIVCALLSGGAGFGGTYLANQLNAPRSGSNTRVTGTGFTLEDATGSKMTVQEIAEQNRNSVVEIRTESVQQDPWVREYVTQGAGSGIIIKSDGYIMTNYHVIEGANTIYVTNDGEKEYEATLVGGDAANDIAVLKIDAKDLSAVTYGNSDQISIGDLAVIIGNPLGELGDTVSAGILSAKDREVTLGDSVMTLMQTDASINPGNSGGGMFNQFGQLVGVVVAKSSGTDVEGLGFAIPINVAATIADEIINTGSYTNPNASTNGTAYSGMTYVAVASREEAQQYGVPSTGIYIKNVSGNNAKSVGFRPGDLVYSIDGKKVDSLDALKTLITSHKPGEQAQYVVIRNNQKVELTLVLEAKAE